MSTHHEPERILIAEDEADIREPFRAWFSMGTLCVDFAESGQEAWTKYETQKLNGQPYDLLVLDISMPDHSGMWVAEQIREAGDEVTKITFFTGIAGVDGVISVDRAKAVKAVGFWPKPLAPDELEYNIRMVLRDGMCP